MFLRSKAKIDNKDTYSNVTIGLLAHTNMFLFLQIETSNSIAATNSIEALLCLARLCSQLQNLATYLLQIRNSINIIKLL